MSEVSPEIISRTQKSLGKYVKKPSLSDKLLKKPPFRFLHDVIKAVIKETGFLEGLFSADELISENVKEKEAKVAFLTKLIDAVKIVAKTDLKVRPSKVVAGLEPVETNILLQTIAKAIDRKIDTKDYVVKINSGEGIAKAKEKAGNKNKKEEKKASSRDRTKTRDASVNRLKKVGNVETPKLTDRTRESSRSKAKPKNDKEKSKSKEEKIVSNLPMENKEIGNNEPEIKNGEPPPSVPSVISEAPIIEIEPTIASVIETSSKEGFETPTNILKPLEEPITSNFSNVRQGSAGLVRPKSARPKSGDKLVSSRGSREDLRENDRPVEVAVPLQHRPPSSLRPPSVRPSSARPGAPRLRPESALQISEPVIMGNINVIVENFDSGLGDDEDTVVIQNAPEVIENDELQGSELLNMSGESKGQLVEQILEQIQEGQEGGTKKRVEIDWEQDGLRGKDATTKEVTRLRSLIQSLTRVANPLGKLMNYLHEDLDAMHNELQTWTNAKKQLYADIEKQKKLAAESSKPLLDKLESLRQEIKKQEHEILTARGNILRNELRIAELLGNK